MFRATSAVVRMCTRATPTFGRTKRSKAVMVRNTFLCTGFTEGMSPVSVMRRRAITDPDDLASTATPTTEGSVLDDLESAAESEDDGDGTREQFETPAWMLALEEQGAAAAQSAIKAGHHSVPDMLAAFRGHVLELSRSSYGHEVLLTAIHYLRTGDVAFIAEEFLGTSRAVALNSGGSLVLCQLLTFSADDARTAAVVDEILALDIEELVCHKFGYRVARAVLECGLPHQQSRLVGSLLKNLQRFARHRFATLVVESAMVSSTQADRQAVCAALVRSQGAVVSLACNSFGIRLIRTLLQADGFAELVTEYLSRGQTRLAKDKYGLQLMKSLGLQSPADSAASERTAASIVMTCKA